MDNTERKTIAAAIQLFDGDLELLEHASVCEIIAAIGDESDRLELKREWIEPGKLAYEACSLANAAGGVIVVGFSDPLGGCKAHPGLDISAKKMLSVVGSLSARVNPPIHVKVRTFEGPDNHNIAVIFVPSSPPGIVYEFLGKEQTFNLPVRRERAGIGSMSLAEVRAKIEQPRVGRRGNDALTASAPWHTNMLPEDVFGIESAPVDNPAAMFQFTEDDDRLLGTGYPGAVETTPLASGVRYTKGVAEAYVLRDGRVALKREWSQDRMPSGWGHLYLALFEAYVLISHVHLSLRLGPRVYVSIVWRTARSTDMRTLNGSIFPEYGHATYFSDFSRQDFGHFAAPFVIDAERSVNQGRAKASIEQELRRFWEERVRSGMVRPDIRDRWF